jgi:hypothetical protein
MKLKSIFKGSYKTKSVSERSGEHYNHLFYNLFLVGREIKSNIRLMQIKAFIQHLLHNFKIIFVNKSGYRSLM